MPARQKLNGVSLYIILALGAIAGLVTTSATVFWVTSGILLAIAVHTGAFRAEGRKKH